MKICEPQDGDVVSTQFCVVVGAADAELPGSRIWILLDRPSLPRGSRMPRRQYGVVRLDAGQRVAMVVLEPGLHTVVAQMSTVDGLAMDVSTAIVVDVAVPE